MVRLLIEDVTLVRHVTISAHVRFRGGKTHGLELPAPISYFESRRTPPESVARIDQLLNSHTDGVVACILNEEGFVTGDKEPFDAIAVGRARRTYGLASRRRRLKVAGLLTATEIAAQPGIYPITARL